MTKTTNYQLSQWAKSDRVMMDDFNADNTKIDAALKANADTAAAASAAVALCGNCAVQHITYTGTGSTVRQFTFAHKPLMLTVFGDNVYFFAVQGAEDATSRRGGSGAAICSVTWEGKSASWTNDDLTMMCNAANQTYQLIALLDAEN